MEILVGKKLSLVTITEICNQLSSVVAAAYTPKSGAAFIIRGSGEMLITKSGIKILTEAKCHHPLSKFILDAAIGFHNKSGDCSKLFIILLSEMMVCIKHQLNIQSDEYILRISLISDIKHLIKVLPCIFCKLRLIIGSNLPVNINFQNPSDSRLKEIVFSFFRTKFPPIIAEHLSLLIHCFISNTVVDFAKPNEAMHFMSKNFPLLCSKISCSLKESCVIDGIIFSKVLSPLLFVDLKGVSFVVLVNLLDTGFEDYMIVADKNECIENFIHVRYTVYGKLVNHFRSKGVSLIFTSSVAEPEFSALCKRNDLVLIDSILDDELELLLSATNATPLDPWQMTENEIRFGKAKFVRTVVLGNRKYLNISPDSYSAPIRLNHLVLCAPVENLCKEYYSECCNLIKVLCNFFSKSSFSCVGNCICDILHKELEGLSELNSERGLHEISSCWACPGALWELNFCRLLHVSCLKSNLASTVLSRGIMNNLKSSCQLTDFVPDMFSKELKDMIYCNIFSGDRTQSFNEPIYNKELLIFSVLSILIQLLGVNEIIYINRKFPQESEVSVF